MREGLIIVHAHTHTHTHLQQPQKAPLLPLVTVTMFNILIRVKCTGPAGVYVRPGLAVVRRVCRHLFSRRLKNILHTTCSFTGFVTRHKWFIFVRVVDSSRPQAYFNIVSICILTSKDAMKTKSEKKERKEKKWQKYRCKKNKRCRRRTDSTVLLKLKSFQCLCICVLWGFVRSSVLFSCSLSPHLFFSSSLHLHLIPSSV